MSSLQATVGATSAIFSDVNPDINVENNYETVINEDAINKSIATILGTRKGSRVFNRLFGSYLSSFLYDPLDAVTAHDIRLEILDAIRTWEPRILLGLVEVLPDFTLQAYYVSIEYTIPALGNKSAVFTFNLATGK